MSGGAFDYLYTKDKETLMNDQTELVEMSKFLRRYNYLDVAADVDELIDCINAANEIDAIIEELEDVFFAVEWYVSGDIPRKQMRAEIERYRRKQRGGGDDVSKAPDAP